MVGNFRVKGAGLFDEGLFLQKHSNFFYPFLIDLEVRVADPEDETDGNDPFCRTQMKFDVVDEAADAAFPLCMEIFFGSRRDPVFWAWR